MTLEEAKKYIDEFAHEEGESPEEIYAEIRMISEAIRAIVEDWDRRDKEAVNG